MDASGATGEVGVAGAEAGKWASRSFRTLYDLYQTPGTIRAVTDRAQTLGLRTRQRVRTGGQTTGGGVFDRGRIHHILTNTLYAGRILHKS